MVVGKPQDARAELAARAQPAWRPGEGTMKI